MSIFKEKHRQNTVSNNKLALIRLPIVIEMTGLNKQRIYELVNNGDFPKQVHITTRNVAWVKSEVEQWIEGRIAQRNGGSK